MPLKSGETDYPKILVYLGAVVDQLKGLAIKCRMLIASEPLFIHIGKNTAESIAYQLFKRTVFKVCKSFISVTEYPVRRLTFLIEHHFNVRKDNEDIVKALVMLVICFIVRGIVIIRKPFDYHLLLASEF